MQILLFGAGRNRERKLRLSGDPPTFDHDDVITVDCNPETKPDVLIAAEFKPLSFDNDFFDQLHFYHSLEHRSSQGRWREFLVEFEDYWRVLKPDGRIYAIVPHWRSQWAWGDPGHTRVITPGTLVFLDQSEYQKQVGVTPMSDYRWCYHADFTPLLAFACNGEEEFAFVLRANKPSRGKI